jgi:hypothetical protein
VSRFDREDVMALILAATDRAARTPRATSWAIDRVGRVPINREVLFAGHAECPNCRAFVRLLTPLGAGSVVGELVAGWCGVCCMTTYFAAA